MRITSLGLCLLAASTAFGAPAPAAWGTQAGKDAIKALGDDVRGGKFADAITESGDILAHRADLVNWIPARWAAVYAYIGAAQEGTGDATKAEAAYRQGVAEDPTDAAPLIELAQFHARRKQFQQADKDWADAGRLPDYAAYPIVRATVASGFADYLEPQKRYAGEAIALEAYFAASGKEADAPARFRALSVLAPSEPEVWHGLGYYEFLKGSQSAALPSLEKAMALKPNESAFHQDLSRAYLALNRPEDAPKEARVAVRVAPKTGQAYRTLGDILYAENKRDEAWTAYKQGITAEPADGENYTTLGQAGGPDPAQALTLVKGLVTDPATLNQGLLSLAAGYEPSEQNARQPADSVLILKEVVRLQPGFALGWLHLGVQQNRAGAEADSLKSLAEASRLAPVSYETQADYAIVAASQQQWAEAARAGGLALAMPQAGLDLYTTMATVYAQLGRTAEMQSAVQRVADGGPDAGGKLADSLKDKGAVAPKVAPPSADDDTLWG